MPRHQGRPPGRFELHIGELVIEGIALPSRARFGAALQTELARLFEQQGVPPALLQAGSVERLNGGALHVRGSVRPELLGAQVARAVYEGLGRCE